jgi:hypothetical protein
VRLRMCGSSTRRQSTGRGAQSSLAARLLRCGEFAQLMGSFTRRQRHSPASRTQPTLASPSFGQPTFKAASPTGESPRLGDDGVGGAQEGRATFL